MTCPVVLYLFIYQSQDFFQVSMYTDKIKERFSIECLKTKPITTGTDNPINQSELVANKCTVAGAKRGKVRASKSRLF